MDAGMPNKREEEEEEEPAAAAEPDASRCSFERRTGPTSGWSPR